MKNTGERKMLKIGYICEPQVGGTYTSFQQVRKRLLPKGIDYRCVPPFDKALFQSSRFAQDEGVDFLDFPDNSPAAKAQRLVRHLVEENYAGIVILPGCYPFVSSLPAYLPQTIRCIARMPHNARGVYRPTAVMSAYLNRIIAVGPRLKRDLTGQYGVDSQKVVVIGNGVDVDALGSGGTASPDRAVFLGRIEDVQKNVYLLPRILEKALQHDANAFLTVIGSGPDADSLRQRFLKRGLDGHFKLTGRVEHEEIPAILGRHGVFILPSRFEGCSNSTLEAMGCGCVPIVSRLPGISDYVIRHGDSGFLLAPDDWKGMGEAWGRLMHAEEEWKRLSRNARERVGAEFSVERMAEAYHALFEAVVTEKDLRTPGKPISAFRLDSRLGPTWRRWVPEGVKKRLRTLAARMGLSP